MIFITVKSEIMDSKRQFEKDLDAERYLKRVKKFHDLTRYRRFLRTANFPADAFRRRRKSIFTMKSVFRYASASDLASIPLKVSILNTEAAQLNFSHQLK